MSTSSETFAARLRALRADANMTQRELAARSGVHRQTIAQLETEVRHPTWETVQLLAVALGVECTAFVDPSLRRKKAGASPAPRRPKTKK